MIDQFTLDANAVAGELQELFGDDMTGAMHGCAHCGNRDAMGSLRAWTAGPGVVLRCSVCNEIVMRWSRTPHGVMIDVRGAAFVRLTRRG